jgi:outer membrane biosynthesis protein TonB
VKLKFTVEADGSVHNIQVVRGLSEELDAEAIRLVCEGPSWRPGIVGGRRAAQTVRLDVPFR